MVFRSRNEEETLEMARLAGKTARGGEVWCLSGDLGAGKTVFVRGLAQGLGLQVPVSSPTFLLYHRYPGRRILHHLDWYRLNTPAEAEGLGWDEILSDPTGVVAVEWGDRFQRLLPQRSLFLSMTVAGEEERRLVLESAPLAEDRREELVRCWQPWK